MAYQHRLQTHKQSLRATRETRQHMHHQLMVMSMLALQAIGIALRTHIGTPWSYVGHYHKWVRHCERHATHANTMDHGHSSANSETGSNLPSQLGG